MKSKCSIFFLFASFLSFSSFGQVFNENPSNPVIDTLLTDNPTEFWTRWKTDPYMTHWEGGSLRIYYGTNNFGVDTQIGTAVSADGNEWVENRELQIVKLGPSGSWDDLNVETPGVIHVPTNPDSMQYMLYYSGGTEASNLMDSIIPGVYPSEIFQIGLAYSNDGIHFTKYNDPSNDSNPLYSESDPVFSIHETIDGLPIEVTPFYGAVAEPSPMYDEEEGIFKMWYVGTGCSNPSYAGENDFRFRILYAESTDGINWGPYEISLDIREAFAFDDQEFMHLM